MQSQMHKTDGARGRLGLALGAVAVGLCGASASAQLHETDYVVRINDSALQTGSVDEFGSTVFPGLVRSGTFGAEGFANFTNDPGVDSSPGDLIPGMQIGFDFVAALREWDGTDFDTISDDTVSARDGGVILATTPAIDQIVPGDTFGESDNDSGAVFHHHVQWFLNFPSTSPAVDGVWLLQWRLWTDEPGIDPTETLYVVFAQGTGVAELDTAVEWVENNLIASGCPADIDGDGDADPDDISAFVNAFTDAVSDNADVDGDGDEDPDDIAAFVDAFVAGCE